MNRPGIHPLCDRTTSESRRAFLRNGSLAAAAVLTRAISGSAARGQDAPSISLSNLEPAPDYRLEIAEIEWELAPKKKIRTAAYNGQIPGPVLRLTEGRPVTIEIANRAAWPEIVHFHGQWIPVAADGASEEGSPMIPPGGRTAITFTPRPSGLHWYHTHAPANRNRNRGLYTGQSGILHVDPAVRPEHPVVYDREQFIVLHDWEPYFYAGGDSSEVVDYVRASVNGRMLGHDAPIQVREGQRVLFQILNASATEPHWLALPGHRFQVLALDGAPVATPSSVELLRIGPAERITALVVMNSPGVWVLGEAQKDFLDAGMGTVIEYAGRAGKPQAPRVDALEWDYRAFGDRSPKTYTPDVTVPLVFTSKFKGQGAFDEWMINGKSYPHTPPIRLRQGLRHRLVFENHSTDNHPVHLHRHNFELVSIAGNPVSGVHKDVVIVEAKTVVEADLLATNPGNTLFHCHQQDHMDSGFMNLFIYA